MSTDSIQPDLNPPWLDREEYPFKHRFFELPMGQMHYVDVGDGKPIVMVHGNPGWSFEYRNVIKALSSSHRCIAPDHLGFGFSDKPYDWDYLPESHAQNFELFLDQLKLDSFVMVVSDWGGPIGLSYALKHPEKVTKIVILNTWMWSVKNDPYYRAFSGMMGGLVGRYFIRQFNIFGKIVVKQAVGDASNLSPDIHAHYYRHLASKDDRKGCAVFPKQIIGSSAWLDGLWQQRARLTSIPTTIIWGMKDIAFREMELNYWIEHLNDPKVIRLQSVGHFPQEESPQTLIEELSS